MSANAEQIAEEFDRIYLEPANLRLKKEREHLEQIRQEMESLVARKRLLAEKMRATIAEIEAEKEELAEAIIYYENTVKGVTANSSAPPFVQG